MVTKSTEHQMSEGYFSPMQCPKPLLNFAILISWSWLKDLRIRNLSFSITQVREACFALRRIIGTLKNNLIQLYASYFQLTRLHRCYTAAIAGKLSLSYDFIQCIFSTKLYICPCICSLLTPLLSSDQISHHLLAVFFLKAPKAL